jgi:hypothetical protein
LWWKKWHWDRFAPSTLVPLPILIPPDDPIHVSSGAGTIGQSVTNVPNGLNLTTPHETIKETCKSERDNVYNKIIIIIIIIIVVVVVVVINNNKTKVIK